MLACAGNRPRHVTIRRYLGRSITDLRPVRGKLRSPARMAGLYEAAGAFKRRQGFANRADIVHTDDLHALHR